MKHRRHLRIPLALTVLLAGVAFGAIASPEARPAGASLRASEQGLMGTGVGMYTDPSVANQVSSFSINPQMVSCGVGTLAAGGEASGPFAMLMYATHMDSYVVDKESGEIRATGRMRSITKIGTAVIEDAEHDFLAVAAATVAHGGFEQAVHAGGDRFDVHFVTPFWSPSNPMATRSALHDGWVRFGGELLLGHVFIDR